MEKNAKIFVAGHRGLVGSALVRTLAAQGYTNVVVRGRTDLDLRNPGAVRAFFTEEQAEYVFLAAARVGGILANRDYPVEFLLENLQIQNSVIEAAHATGVSKLMFLGSSCIYPKMSQQPIKEEYLLVQPKIKGSIFILEKQLRLSPLKRSVNKPTTFFVLNLARRKYISLSRRIFINIPIMS